MTDDFYQGDGSTRGIFGRDQGVERQRRRRHRVDGHWWRILAANHLKKHPLKMMSTLTIALKHSKEEEEE